MSDIKHSNEEHVIRGVPLLLEAEVQAPIAVGTPDLVTISLCRLHPAVLSAEMIVTSLVIQHLR